MPNIDCTIAKVTGTDLYGQPEIGFEVPARCGVVKLQSRREKTSVRADSSASRGNAAENTVKSVLLFKPDVDLAQGDMVTVMGLRLRVVGIEPRIDVLGKHDHNEVELDLWG